MGIAIPQVITPSKASGAQVIDGSLKFDSNKSTHLSRTPSYGGNRKTWTWSGWVKRCALPSNHTALFTAGTVVSDSGFFRITFHANGHINVATGSTNILYSGGKLRDFSAWYHVLVSVDTTASSNQVKCYLNGTLYDQATAISNVDTAINSTVAHQIGRDTSETTHADIYLAQVHFVDGQALTPSEFGFTDPLTNTWKPKKYTGTFAIASGTPSVANGGLVIRADGASINGTFGVGGSVKTWTSPDGVTWTRDGSGRTGSAAKYLAVGGAGTALRTFYPDAGSGGFSFYMYNGGGEFDGTTTPFTLDLSSQTYLPSQTSSFGDNGFYLPLDGNSPIGEDQSGNGNDWTPVSFGGSVELDSPTVSGARPILNTTQGGTQAGVGVFGSKQNVGYAVTVYNDGGGNKYYIDGVKQDTVTGLIRGATYTFDTSDSTVSSHPFRFSATSNGSHGGGSEYTNGVAAITGAATTITVPHDAPNTLYYYCTSHSGMGADITGITTNEKLADQYASNIVLASPLVGANSDVSASIACTMTNKAITSNGNAVGDTTESNFYSGSFYFDGTGDTLTAGSSSDFTMGTGDFTIECFALKTTANHKGIFQISDTSGGLKSSSYGDTIAVGARTSDWQIYGAGTNTESSTYNIVANIWYHIAYVRSSGTSKLYVNGIEVISKSNDTTNYNGTYLVVGGYYSSSYLHDGYIQDFRIYKGVAKYTSNFVVPSRSPDILPDTPSGVSGDSKLTKITDGAVAFDGSGDYLTVAWSTDFELGTGDFTIEYYGYSRNNGTAITWGADINNRFDLGSITEGNVRFFCRSSSSTFIELDADVATEKWAHIAAVREGTTFRLYVDGKLEASGTASNTMPNDSSNTLDIGRRRYASTGANPYEGFISNVRIIKGTALYTSNFTPPSAPLTDVTNTKLLCCQSNTSAETGAVVPFKVNNNSGTAGAYAPTGLTGGIDFPGGQGNSANDNGSFLSTPSTSFGGNYTIEFWFNVDELPSDGSGYGSVFFDGRPASTNADNILGSIYGYNTTGATNNFTIRYHADSVDKITGSTQLSVNTWYHYALVRNNGTVTQYINGTADGSYSHSTAIITNADRPYVGGWGHGSSGDAGTNLYAVNGSMSNLRMTSTAVYTANFTPPTSNLTAISGTTFLGLQSTSSATAFSSAVGVLNTNGDAAATNFNPFNTDIDTVRGQETGYATLNPLIGSAGLTNVTLSNGNLTFANSDTSYRRYVPSNISMPLNTGKYYFEGVYTKSPDSNNAIYDSFGLIDTSKVGVGTFGPSNVAGTWVYSKRSA